MISKRVVAPWVRFEPTTSGLTAGCCTTQLPRTTFPPLLGLPVRRARGDRSYGNLDCADWLFPFLSDHKLGPRRQDRRRLRPQHAAILDLTGARPQHTHLNCRSNSAVPNHQFQVFTLCWSCRLGAIQLISVDRNKAGKVDLSVGAIGVRGGFSF